MPEKDLEIRFQEAVEKALEIPQSSFVLCTATSAGNNSVLICRVWESEKASDFSFDSSDALGVGILALIYYEVELSPIFC